MGLRLKARMVPYCGFSPFLQGGVHSQPRGQMLLAVLRLGRGLPEASCVDLRLQGLQTAWCYLLFLNIFGV